MKTYNHMSSQMLCYMNHLCGIKADSLVHLITVLLISPFITSSLLAYGEFWNDSEVCVILTIQNRLLQ